jgi:hypothetical protein
VAVAGENFLPMETEVRSTYIITERTSWCSALNPPLYSLVMTETGFQGLWLVPRITSWTHKRLGMTWIQRKMQEAPCDIHHGAQCLSVTVLIASGKILLEFCDSWGITI